MIKKAVGGRKAAKKKPAGRAGTKRVATPRKATRRPTIPQFSRSAPVPARVVSDRPSMRQTMTFRVSGFANPLSYCQLNDPNAAIDQFKVDQSGVLLGTDAGGQFLQVPFTYTTTKEKSAESSGQLLITIDSNGQRAERSYGRIVYEAIDAPSAKAKPRR